MRYLLLLLPLALLGCADSSTTGTNREYDIRVDISNNTGPVSLTFPLNVDSTSSTDQTTENASDIAPDVNLQLVQPGATGSLSGADSVLTDTISKFRDVLKRDAEKEAVEQLPVPTPPVVVPDDIRTETGTYHGRHNGDRPTWYFSKDFREYPSSILLDIPGCYENKLITHNNVRYDVGNLVFKQSDVTGRHMAIVAPQSCKSETATITY